METEKKELNIIITIVLVLVILRHLINIGGMITGYTLVSSDIAIVSVALSILVIACLIFILKLKRWAVISFFYLQGLTSIVYCDLGYRVMPDALIPAIAYSAVLYGLLQFKKNGISGWNLIMK